jgi:chromosome segregation ATPase
MELLSSSPLKVKLYTVNAGSFTLGPVVEEFLRTRNAISLDFGATAYISPEAMSAILSELIEKLNRNLPCSDADLVSDLKAQVVRLDTERQKLMDDNTRLISQLQSEQLEISTLKRDAANSTAVIEALKTENAKLQTALKAATTTTSNSKINNTTTASKAANPIVNDDKIKQSYEKLQKEFQLLRSQSVETIASLKVLEEENEELRQALDETKNQKMR